MGRKEIFRYLKIIMMLAVFSAPLAYAQNRIFVTPKSDKTQSSEKKRAPSLFVRPGQKKSSKSVFIRKKRKPNKSLAQYARRKSIGIIEFEGGNQFIGSEGHSNAKLAALLKSNRAVDFEIMRKESLTLRKKVMREQVRREKMRELERMGYVPGSGKYPVAKKIAKKKRQVFVRKSSGGIKKPSRVFNTPN